MIERADGLFLGLPKFAVLRPDNSSDWISSLGDTVEEALEDALNNFVKSLGDRQDLPDDSFSWSDRHDF